MERSQFMRILSLSVVVVLVALIGESGAARVESEPPQDRWSGSEPGPPLALAPHINSNRVAADLDSPSDPSAGITDLNDWSYLVYHSFNDLNDWEIYLSRPDGTEAILLTNNGAHDLYPRLDRGCRRVVFVSNRDGNYELYTVRVDGSGLTRLTNHPETDYYPAWSPDGNQIVFQSYRDGQAEIYRLDIDSRITVRLTDNPAWDGTPSWSPDGQRIAFASNRGGADAIWVMDADGANQTHLTSEHWSENPVWSPDSAMIAFDADGDDDGWFEIYLMNADGSGRQVVHDPSPQPGMYQDAYVRSWSPDGNTIAFTEVTLIEYQGQWYWIYARLRGWDLSSGAVWTIMDADLHWAPDWQTADLQAPISAVDNLEEESRTDVEVTWSGADRGPAGLAELVVQIRQSDDGVWTDWQSGIQPWAWHATLTKQSAETFHFRSQAVDEALNTEPWPRGGEDTSVTFYDWAIFGTVHGNRQDPIENAGVIAGPAAFRIQPSDPDGAYRALFEGDDSTFALRWGKEGYGPLPDTSFQSESDALHDVFLPPHVNVIADGGFESGGFGPGGWTATGAYPPAVGGAYRHTGEFGVWMGLPFSLAPSVKLRDAAGTPGAPLVATDGANGVHVIWTEGSAYYYQVVYVHRAAGGDWEFPVYVSQAGDIRQLAWTVADDGHVHAVWRQRGPEHDTIFHAWRDVDGTWSAPQVVHDEGRMSLIRLVGTADGDGHLIWQLTETDHDDHYYSYVDRNGTWASPVPTGLPGMRASFDLAVERDGRVHLLSQPGTDSIYYSYRQDDGDWSTRETVYPGSYNQSPRLFVDDQGTVDVLWANTYGDDRVLYRRRTAAGIWSAVRELSAGTTPDGRSIAALGERDGTVHVALAGDELFPCPQLYYARRDRTGRWIGPTLAAGGGTCVGKQWFERSGANVYLLFHSVLPDYHTFCYLQVGPGGTAGSPNCVDSPCDDYPNAVIDRSGILHATWRSDGGVGQSDIQYAQTATIEESGDSSVTQVVQIPLTMTNPTLSFAYSLGGGRLDGEAKLAAQLGHSTGTTTVFSTTTSGSWKLGWADLSAWARETVTLTLSAHQEAGDPALWSRLDEVALGPSYPDLWIALAGPEWALTGSPVRLEIVYGNRHHVPAAGGQITLTLPVDLSYVAANPPPDATEPSLRWDLGTLAGGSGPISIVVTTTMAAEYQPGYTVTAVAGLSCQTPEIEGANNQDKVTIQVGQPLLIPLLMKE